MPGPDSPDWQATIQIVPSAQNDAPDWQVIAVGPGGTPITPTPVRTPLSRVDDWSDSANNLTSLAVAPANLGDIIVLGLSVFGSGSVPAGPSSGDGGVTTWTPITSGLIPEAFQTVYGWWGVVTTIGAGVPPITWSLSSAVNVIAQACELGTGTAAPTWEVYGSTWNGRNSGANLSWYSPALTPQGSVETYLAFIATGRGGLSMPLFLGTLVTNGGALAGYSGIAMHGSCAYPTNYEFGCDTSAPTTIYVQWAVLVYATI